MSKKCFIKVYLCLHGFEAERQFFQVLFTWKKDFPLTGNQLTENLFLGF